MILGVLLGISLAINLVSILIIVTSSSGILRENIATGAVIGISQATSYSFVTLSISLIATLFLIVLIKKS